MSVEPIRPPSARRLAAITGIALIGAGVLFAAFVAPAEFHADPLGVGKLTGLNRLAGPKTVAVAPAQAQAQAQAQGAAPAVNFYPAPYRTDEIDIPLAGPDAAAGGYELEYKVKVKKGDSFVYAWTVEGVTNPEEFYFDFHGESPPNPEVKVVEYRQATGLSSNGVLIAPMDGVFGWFLQNSAVKPVVVHLKLSGFYELVPPGGQGNEAGILAKRQ